MADNATIRQKYMMKDKKFLILSSFFFLVFIAAMTTMFMDKPTSQILRAKNTSPSPLKSFAAIFPQVGKVASGDDTDQATKIKVSIFLRDTNGEVLPSRTIKLSTSLSGVSITPSDTQTTDSIGQAQFFLTSTKPGKAQLTVVDVSSNTNIVNIPTVEFTE
jgi:hypothetical protein